MAITVTVETGAGVTGANAYQTEAAAVTWLQDRGMHRYAGLSATDQARVLVGATEFLERELEFRLRGERRFTTQPLAWPRNDSVDRVLNEVEIDEVPAPWIEATALMAERIAAAEAAGDQSHEAHAKSFADDFPEVWRRAGGAFPSGLRLGGA